ncbi:hypothetical protein [Cellulomonas denverensis]|uniref:Uncharacterized protein n=1 Tax=Cellulomonas denverensis TaxID=264297 RepID=A0A7X6KV64_9CELL|nr:hypothetical protein [Cellulomonas denverensis]NKY22906.1 hypothetical protein [Cellulomonas denverensis]GIG24020.1 hypothetical protein Cde04nite_02640 [Cellulomonas denverensis]
MSAAVAPRRTTRRKVVALTIAALGITGLGLASAAQLNLTSGALGAGTTVVASCDTDGVAVKFADTFSTTAKGYAVTGITLSGVSTACAGQGVTVDLLDNDPAAAATSIGTVTATVPAGGGTVTIPVTASVKASDVKGVAVVIAG